MLQHNRNGLLTADDSSTRQQDEAVHHFLIHILLRFRYALTREILFLRQELSDRKFYQLNAIGVSSGE